ncbi:flagellar associated protein [Reticulomyxa filosa]|uniref:Flagellar associated protein n=1 Tax=Reticulomyxa filosa TaxID=46433 RepID=X6MKH2_RETFI|nr:flagellar associated protein [Reticulomyxa filosa]|eukprot:ETO14508.1 flagellar associated protein [Reticulomyxa filosa]
MTTPETKDFGRIEKDFELVLSNLLANQSLERFREEFEKLHDALKRSHENEKKLIQKSNELNNELINQNTVEKLKSELERAWKMVEAAETKEKKIQQEIEALKNEMDHSKIKLQLMRMRTQQCVELIKECEKHTKLIEKQQADINAVTHELNQVLSTNKNDEQKMNALKAEIQKLKHENERCQRRIEKSEKQLLDFKKLNDDLGSRNKSMQNENLSLKEESEKITSQTKTKDTKIHNLMSEFNELKVQSSELMEQLELMKDDVIQSNKSKKSLMQQLKQEKIEKLSSQNEVASLKKKLENQLQNKHELLTKTQTLVNEKTKLRDLLNVLKEEMSNHLQKEMAKDSNKIKEFQIELNNLGTHLKMFAKTNETLSSENEALQVKNKELVNELNKYKSNVSDLTKENKTLLQKCEKCLNDWNGLNHKTSKINKDNALTEEINRHKTKDVMFENVKNERNVLSNNLSECKDEMSEMKRKFKMQSHIVTQLKDEIGSKEKLILKQHFENKYLTENVSSLNKKCEKQSEVISKCDQLLSAKSDEINILRNAINEFQLNNKKQKQVAHFCLFSFFIVTERDILSTQLIRRNDEMALCLDKIKLLENLMKQGEVQYMDKANELKVAKINNKNLTNKLASCEKQLNNLKQLKIEYNLLQNQLLNEKSKVKALSEELENPINVHRWRQISGKDLSNFEMIHKIHMLQKKLIEKSEEAVSLNLMFKEKEKMCTELKNMLNKQPGAELLHQLSSCQMDIKTRNKKIKALHAELNMLQTQINQLKFENDKLKKDLSDIKKKYFQFKKAAQLAKEPIETYSISGDPNNENINSYNNTEANELSITV